MKIVILGDPHIPKRAKHFPKRLLAELKTADAIIHTGDFQTIDVYNDLRVFAPVHAVIGNVDSEELQQVLPYSLLLPFDDVTIGVTHGHGKGKTTEKRALSAFEHEQVDAVIFGHSHIPIHKQIGDITLFNPGSATDKRREKQFSFGLLYIQKNTLHFEHVFYDSKD
ncbi:YfcE family phosphodiesterase [Priestia megaterium]|uniref:Phosphoesterase n=1 Tax=Priestia megaterium TaxID=1404 RepID=A0A3D8X802_PRIMG|nr:metallophosphoesterase [Priestia megaterium]MDH3170309.1 metallophosphoesterase [Priestia megaterium]RDZ18023.1 YfcE family phosphodiesterase [Priestia megaterium]